VYVVITHADHIAGFNAFTDALPDNLQQDMLGWSNPHAADVMFERGWIDEAFVDLHRTVVQMQVELFATSRHLERASELFLFSGELQRIAEPTRELLDEIFRPSVYRSASLFRGFYLTGLAPDRAETVVTADDVRGARLPISFVGDLLNRKVFSERGLALPLPGAAVARNRVSTAAQVTAAGLAIVLTAGTLRANSHLRQMERVHDGFFQDVATGFEQRIAVVSNQRAATDAERIAQGYQLLQGVAGLGVENFHSVFMPASRIAPIEPSVERILQATFGELILPGFRLGLEAKGRELFAFRPGPAAADDDDAVLARPTLADSPHYRALQHFATEYRHYVDNYFRYVRLSTHESGDVNELADLGNYVTGRAGMQRITIPEEPYG